MIAAMCEQFVARAAEPFRLEELWPLAGRMERYGIAGFGWGVTWLGGDGELHEHRDTRAFRDDPSRDEVGRQQDRTAAVRRCQRTGASLDAREAERGMNSKSILLGGSASRPGRCCRCA